MAGSTTKKVLIRRFDREALTGFVNAQSYLQPAGVELLSPSGAPTCRGSEPNWRKKGTTDIPPLVLSHKNIGVRCGREEWAWRSPANK